MCLGETFKVPTTWNLGERFNFALFSTIIYYIIHFTILHVNIPDKIICQSILSTNFT